MTKSKKSSRPRSGTKVLKEIIPKDTLDKTIKIKVSKKSKRIIRKI